MQDLDNADFKKRSQATSELKRIGHAAEPLLVKELAGKPSLEMKMRVDQLLARVKGTGGAYELRQLRIIDVLEHVNTPPPRENC